MCVQFQKEAAAAGVSLLEPESGDTSHMRLVMSVTNILITDWE